MRRVDVAPALLNRIRTAFGQGTRPDASDFELGPLAAAVWKCERDFDRLAPSQPGSPIRVLLLPPSGLFGPVAFYVLEVNDADAPGTVEIVGYDIDNDYWENLDQVEP